MKTILTVLFLFIIIVTHAQNKYFTKSGTIGFYSHAPMEDITATNSQVAAFLNVNTGELSFAALIKSFEFEKALMQEHFNENYMESDRYPKAIFKGNVRAYDRNSLMGGKPYKVKVYGELTIRGIPKILEVDATLHLVDTKIIGESSFIVKPDDFNIKIPAIVKDNIAKEIEVSVNAQFEPYNR